MFSKNLRFYRLQKNLTKKQLADKCGLPSKAISDYESGEGKPDIEIIKKLAAALNIKVSDFLFARNKDLRFTHGEFRKKSKLTKIKQSYIKEAVEEYCNRFCFIVSILGNDVIACPPECHKLVLTDDTEKNALNLRQHLGLPNYGPICNLTEILEDLGIIIICLDIDSDDFSGMNGFANDRPYIVYNAQMGAERNRSTIAHELAHLMFAPPDAANEQALEKSMTAVSGAFLLPGLDLIHEIGAKRSKISNDMIIVSKKYGVSMYLLTKRAQVLHIISDSSAKYFFISAGKRGWKKDEPQRISAHHPVLFEQLVYRAIDKKIINVNKGAELLKTSVTSILHNCSHYNGFKD